MSQLGRPFRLPAGRRGYLLEAWPRCVDRRVPDFWPFLGWTLAQLGLVVPIPPDILESDSRH